MVRVEVLERSVLSETDYEQIIGRLHFEIDPKLPGNAIIADVGLAPRNAKGRVEFSSDLLILKPKEALHGKGATWVEIPNRGGKSGATDWIMRNRFTLVSVGWQFDVPSGPDKLGSEIPAARNTDGTPIRGGVRAAFTPDNAAAEQTVGDLTAYPPVDINGPDSRLVVRTRAALPGGSEVPRSRWSMDGNRLRLEGGFDPGKTYELSYLAEAPPVGGLGFAAVRDAVTWLRHSPDSLAPNRHVYASGVSQCGRFLRDFLYLGFNTDEQNRQVFDGVIAQVAGAGRLALNQRWATPMSLAIDCAVSYPFADTAQKDPVSGHEEGLLDNPRVRHLPKVFYLNSSTEYWGASRVAALTHTNPEGTRDVGFPPNVRAYFFAATSHGPAPFPPTALVEGSPLANPVSAGASILALRMAMHRWVAEGEEPPASVYPRLNDGTLTTVGNVRFPAVPGLNGPGGMKAGVRVRNPQWPDGAGEGAELPLLVPQVDGDGNDLGGIRVPDSAVPLGTSTGWVFRPASLGSPHELVALRGAWVPFATTKAQREKTNDPRLSIEERYASKEEYLAKVKAAAENLIGQRLLSESDIESQVKQAAARWDWVMSQSSPSTSTIRNHAGVDKRFRRTPRRTRTKDQENGEHQE